MNLKDVIAIAETKGVAVGHFNFAESTVAEAAAEAAEELGVSVILGTSEKEREFLGEEFLRDLISGHRKTDFVSVSPKASIFGSSDVHAPIFFNADHTKSFEKVKEAVEIGYDSILFDGSELPLEENIKRTREVVEYVKKTRPEVLVEGEIGYIGSGSKMRDEAPEGIELTKVEDAVRFVKETDVDLLAPAVGNVHGIIKTGEPKLDIERIRAIKEAVKIPLVLHGASGNSDEDIKAAIKAGIIIIHINTEVRLAWQKALHDELHRQPGEIAPYKIMEKAKEAAKEVIIKKLHLFNNLL